MSAQSAQFFSKIILADTYTGDIITAAPALGAAPAMTLARIGTGRKNQHPEAENQPGQYKFADTTDTRQYRDAHYDPPCYVHTVMVPQ